MFHGFDPSTSDPVFVRRSRRSLALALLGHVLVLGTWAYRDHLREPEVAVLLEPEIKDLAVDEQPEPEPEPEDEPPPPPPDVPAPRPAAKPKPKPKLDPPKTIPDRPPPEQAAPRDDKNFGTGTPGPTSGPAKKPEPPKKPDPPKKVDLPKKSDPPIDPTKPVDRPERASVPKPDPGNKMPDYPASLRDAGIEGEVVLKLHVHHAGTVKGAKILRATNTASGDDDRARAEKLFKAAVIAAVKAWRYTPSRLDGQPISVWIIVNFPFRLTGAA